MSRESLLDEAIAKAKEAEDWQLVEWLRMARGSESAARWYSDKLREAHRTERKLLDENAELRERVKGFLGQRDERLAAAETRCNELMDLVRHMGTCIQHLDRTDEDGGCVRCPYQTVEHDCGFEQRMRKLGIETS